jgi:ABC-2 type transport system ATP-binding protein
MITAENIDFSYQKGEKIINNLSFSVPENSIFGFLGANGSGKTTTIRILLNLCKPSNGTVKIQDKTISPSEYGVFNDIGALIENPSLYNQLTAYENLKLLANYHKVSDERIGEVLDMVGLSDVKDKKVKKYSMGMKQRLGIAQSVLHDPKILILDEPLNGLDPRGINEIRNLLFKFKEQGKTIFISSHLLDEIQKTCDHVCIIDKGQKLFLGKIDELQAQISQQHDFRIKCSSTENAAKVLKDKFQFDNIKLENNGLILSLSDIKLISDCIKVLVNANISIYEVNLLENSLEDLFLKLTANN